MATSAANVRVGVTGGAYHAPTSTALPTNATDALAAGFVEVGYIGEDGISQSIEANTQDIRAWQNGDVVRKVQTSHDLTYTFTMIETNQESLRVYYADDDASFTTTEVKADAPGLESWVLELADGTKGVRIVLPSAQVTERGEVVWKNDEAVAYEITLTAYADSSGVKAYIYGDAGSGVAPTITSILPSLGAVGSLVTITGANFTGTSAISMDSQPVVSYIIVSDSKIVMEIPASVSGAAATTVTNATGASSAYSYTAATP